jgi:DNA-binding transcriptional MocR family regulator
MFAEWVHNGKSHSRGPLLRRRELFIPAITLDRTSATPLHCQIYRQMAEQYRGGAIPSDARLPSTRLMARILQVSRNTVMAAYENLAADGLVRGDRGSGTGASGSAAPAAPWIGLHHVIRASGYPSRIVAFDDPDGNSLYLRI